MKHFLHFKNYSKKELKEIIDLALQIKKEPEHYWHALEHKTLIMLFQKNSTRTRVSFETAMTELGGHAIFLDWQHSALSVGATLVDEAKTLSRYGTLLAGRLKFHRTPVMIAENITIPVINMLCEKYHPCQALGDLLTIYEKHGSLENCTLVYTGIANNVSNSLIEAGTKLGVNIILAVPEKDPQAVDIELEQQAQKTGLYTETSDLKATLARADFLYTDTWVNVEFFNDPAFQKEKERRIKVLQPFQINGKLLKETSTKAKIMHCQPMHEGYEITRDAIEHPQSIIFDQAENRLHIQKAILVWLLQNN